MQTTCSNRKPINVDTRGILMNTQAMSLNEIRRTGIEVLTKKLGIVGMVRFLQQN